tara:strand:+ start:680 stop:1189 length:510 start_codon:yes stop_codon:yes gene_type:complete
MDVINGITLQYMANMNHYQKYVKRNSAMEIVIRDIQFYKDKFLDLTKHLCEEKIHSHSIDSSNSSLDAIKESHIESDMDIHKDVYDAFHVFAETCISYFQFLDKQTELQNQEQIPPSTDNNANLSLDMNLNPKTCKLDHFVKRKSSSQICSKKLSEDISSSHIAHTKDH